VVSGDFNLNHSDLLTLANYASTVSVYAFVIWYIHLGVHLSALVYEFRDK